MLRVTKTHIGDGIVRVNMSDGQYECEMEVSVETSLCAHAGSFESEPPFTMYFWMLAENDIYDDHYFNISGSYTYVYTVTQTHLVAFPELKAQKIVVVWKGNEGFVNHAWFMRDEDYLNSRAKDEELEHGDT